MPKRYGVFGELFLSLLVERGSHFYDKALFQLISRGALNPMISSIDELLRHRIFNKLLEALQR
jgi:hypothetical protein